MARIITNSDGSRTLHLGGEMDFPIGITAGEAFARCSAIAEDCGYLVSWKYGHSAFSICGGDIVGYYVLDWFDRERPGPEKIEHWSCKAEYIPQEGAVEAR